MLAWRALSMWQKIVCILLGFIVLAGSALQLQEAQTAAKIVYVVAGFCCVFCFLLNPICFIPSRKSFWYIPGYPPICRWLLYVGFGCMAASGMLLIARRFAAY